MYLDVLVRLSSLLLRFVLKSWVARSSHCHSENLMITISTERKTTTVVATSARTTATTRATAAATATATATALLFCCCYCCCYYYYYYDLDFRLNEL